jgi:WD40 repeat protein
VETGKQRAELRHTCYSYPDDVEQLLEDGSTLVTRTSGGLSLWDVTAAKELRRLRITGYPHFDRDARFLLTRFRDSSKLWDAQTGEEIATLNTARVKFSPDGRTLATYSSETGIIKLYDVDALVDCIGSSQISRKPGQPPEGASQNGNQQTREK